MKRKNSKDCNDANKKLRSPGKVSENSRDSKGSTNTLKPQNYDDEEGHLIIINDSFITTRYTIVRLLGQGTFGKGNLV